MKTLIEKYAAASAVGDIIIANQQWLGCGNPCREGYKNGQMVVMEAPRSINPRLSMDVCVTRLA